MNSHLDNDAEKHKCRRQTSFTASMQPFSRIIALCCSSVALLSLANCGGSSSSSGYAPDSLNETTVVMDLAVTGNANFPTVFTMTIASGAVTSITTKGSNIPLWNERPTLVYQKLEDNVAKLNLTWIQGTANTENCGISIPRLIFEERTLAKAGPGATASYTPAGQPTQIVENVGCNVTIHYAY